MYKNRSFPWSPSRKKNCDSSILNSLGLSNIPKPWTTTCGPESAESVAYFYDQLILDNLLRDLLRFIFCWNCQNMIFRLCCFLFGPTGDLKMFMVHILISSYFVRALCITPTVPHWTATWQQSDCMNFLPVSPSGIIQPASKSLTYVINWSQLHDYSI